jgi:hypothetical protein
MSENDKEKIKTCKDCKFFITNLKMCGQYARIISMPKVLLCKELKE